MENIRPEPGWKALAGKLRRKTSLFIGMTDAGKTTIIRYVAMEILSGGDSVCIVDSDVGQSSLGPPGTVSMKIFKKPGDMESLYPGKMFFIGITNPARGISAVVDAASRMVKTARELSMRTILVDTTGLVLGWPGRALKLAKIRAISPGEVIAVERANELKHILSEIHSVSIHRIRASRYAREKTRAERTRYRNSRLEEYFMNSRRLRLNVSKVEFLLGGEPSDAGSTETGTIVGLNRDDETLGLGIFEKLRDGIAVIRTPLRNTRRIKTIVTSGMIFGQA